MIGLQDFTLENIYDKLVHLPTFPKVVQNALAILSDPNYQVSNLIEILKYDPAVTANLLKVVNSAHFGLRQKVFDLASALPLLGAEKIREVLLASASMPYLIKPVSGYSIGGSGLWAHSMASALTADILSAKCRFSDSSKLFTAALLHDIGKIAMNLYVGEKVGVIYNIAREDGISFAEAEWRVLGADHAIIGSELLKHWDFPHDVVRSVRNHHDPDLYIQDDLSAMLALSNILVVQLGIGVGAGEFRYRVHPELLSRLSITRNDIHDCLVEVVQSYEESHDLLNLE